MPQVGPLEILVVGALALIVFGPQRLPEVARTVGRAINELRRMAGEVKTEFEAGWDGEERVDDETSSPVEDESAAAGESPAPETR